MIDSASRTAWIVTMATLLACSSNDEPPDPGDPVLLDVDVHIERNTVWITPREVNRPCECNSEWPAPGECGPPGGTGCDCTPGPASCLREFRIEREGVVLGSIPYTLVQYGVETISIPGLESMTGNELVLEGCGATARVPLPDGRIAVPRLTEVTNDQESTTLRWEPGPTPVSGLATMWGEGGDTISCHDETEGATGVQFSGPIAHSVAWKAIHPAEVVETEMGQVRVWQVGSYPGLTAILRPSPLDDGRFELPSDGGSGLYLSFPHLSLTVFELAPDPIEIRTDIAVELAALDVAGETTLVELDSSGSEGAVELQRFHYRADPSGDSLTVQLDSGVIYTGDFPHVAPTDDLDVGTPFLSIVPLPNRYRLELGPVTLADEAGAVDPIGVSLALTWDLPSISRPEL